MLGTRRKQRSSHNVVCLMNIVYSGHLASYLLRLGRELHPSEVEGIIMAV